MCVCEYSFRVVFVVQFLSFLANKDHGTNIHSSIAVQVRGASLLEVKSLSAFQCIIVASVVFFVDQFGGLKWWQQSSPEVSVSLPISGFYDQNVG